jgi:hypothetical protein
MFARKSLLAELAAAAASAAAVARRVASTRSDRRRVDVADRLQQPHNALGERDFAESGLAQLTNQQRVHVTAPTGS